MKMVAANSAGVNRESQSNGSLMRATPIAVYCHLIEDEDLVHKIVTQDCSFMHSHQNVNDTVFLYCLAIGKLIRHAGDPNRAKLALDAV